MTAAHQPTVGFLPWWPQNPYQVLLKQALNDRGWRVIGNPPLSLLRILIGRDGLDVVHVHWPHGLYQSTWQMLHVLAVLVLYRLRKNNIVWTAHELTAYESRQPRRDAWFRSMVMRLSRHLIVHGQSTRRLVVEQLGFQRPVSVALHPAYVGWYPDRVTRSEARQALGLQADSQVFLYFGYVKPYKGVEDLIAAFASLGGADKALLVVGKPLDDAIRVQVDAMAAKDPRIRTRLAYVADGEVQHYFRAADVVVFPFRETQTSGSLMLALTFGRPVVAPNIATLSEYVDDRMAVLYDPSREAALASALHDASNAPLQAMAEEASRRAAELGWNDMADVHLYAYNHRGNTR